MNYTCSICLKSIKGDHNKLTAHFRSDHHFETANCERERVVICGQSGCPLAFKSMALFRKHLLQCEQKKISDRQLLQQNTSSSQSNDALPEVCNDSVVPSCDIGNDVPNTSNSENSPSASKNPFARLCLTMRSEYYYKTDFIHFRH